MSTVSFDWPVESGALKYLREVAFCRGDEGFTRFRQLEANNVGGLVEFIREFAPGDLVDERHNDAPSLGSFVALAERYSGSWNVWFEGYVVSGRDDARVTIDTVEFTDVPGMECIEWDGLEAMLASDEAAKPAVGFIRDVLGLDMLETPDAVDVTGNNEIVSLWWD